jgi:nucleotide-binding universal stress UspA family protein
MVKATQNILLASHGTIGAQAAEQKVFEMCASNAHITHLLVVPEFWKDMLGDDWLNNSVTRIQFEDYLETELGQEVDQHIDRVHSRLEKLGICSTHKIVFGNPDKCLVNTCGLSEFDLIVMGSPRPKGTAGLRSRMTTKFTARQLTIPLLAVPHPNA